MYLFYNIVKVCILIRYMKASIVYVICVIALICSASAIESVGKDVRVRLNYAIEKENTKIEKPKDFDIILFFRRLIFGLGKQNLAGFTQAYEQNFEDLPDTCMNDTFQVDFLNKISHFINDLFYRDISELIYVIISNIVNISFDVFDEVHNVWKSKKFVEDLISLYENAFRDGFINGLVIIFRMAKVHISKNLSTFLSWTAIGFLSMITFQEYYFGYALGTVWRIILNGS